MTELEKDEIERQAAEKLGLNDLLRLVWEKSRPHRWGFLLGVFALSFSFFLIASKTKSPALEFQTSGSPPRPAATPGGPLPLPQAVLGTESAQIKVGAKSKGSTKTNKINLNTASARELEALPSLGPVIAGRIIEFRQRRGPFKRVEDLDAVKGIGPKMIEKIRPFVDF